MQQPGVSPGLMEPEQGESWFPAGDPWHILPSPFHHMECRPCHGNSSWLKSSIPLCSVPKVGNVWVVLSDR